MFDARFGSVSGPQLRWIPGPGRLWLLALVVSCVSPVDEIARTQSFEENLTVGSLDARQTGCSTRLVAPLSVQIAEEMACAEPAPMVQLALDESLVAKDNSVLPYLVPAAAEDLTQTAATNGPIVLLSAFRSVAQQWLLYRWRRACGLVAYAPGASDHEQGRAVDIENWWHARDVLAKTRWRKAGARDPAHFEFLAAPKQPGRDIIAFQRLWNRFHPEDPLVVSGAFDSETESRLARSPASGFSIASCDDGEPCFSAEGAWAILRAPLGFHGTRYALLGQGLSGSATFRLTAPTNGTYEVYLHLPPAESEQNGMVAFVGHEDSGEGIEVAVPARSAGAGHERVRAGIFSLPADASLFVRVNVPSGPAVVDLASAELVGE